MKAPKFSLAITEVMFNVLLFCLLIAASREMKAQNRERVSVSLKSGRVISGHLLEATIDSLVVSEKNRILEGCLIRGKLKYSDIAFRGIVRTVSDSTVELSMKEIPYRQVIHFSQMKSVKGPSSNASRIHRTSIGVDQIENIQLRKTYQEVLDSVIEREGGAGLAWTMGEAPSGTFRQGTAASVGIPIGIIAAPLTSAICLEKTTYWIHGDRDRYFLFLTKSKTGRRAIKPHHPTLPEIIVRAHPQN